eukprot:5939773-Lingulodinium_polyedra.AAC.2
MHTWWHAEPVAAPTGDVSMLDSWRTAMSVQCIPDLVIVVTILILKSGFLVLCFKTGILTAWIITLDANVSVGVFSCSLKLSTPYAGPYWDATVRLD